MKSTIIINPTGWPNNSAMRMPLPKGDAGIDLTVAAMQAIAHDAQNSPTVKALAATLKADAARAGQSTGEAVYWFMRRHVVFARDPNGVEKLTTPDQMIEAIRADGDVRADCDELATLAVALLRAMGVPPALIVMSSKPRQTYHHVFFGVYDYRLANQPVGHSGQVAMVVPFNPQERTPPGKWPPASRVKAYQV